MPNYQQKSYGRNQEIKFLFDAFKRARNISMHGPRRLGKTFLLDRLLENAAQHGFCCVKADLSRCTDPAQVWRELIEKIEARHSGRKIVQTWLRQKFRQLTSPNQQAGESVPKALLQADPQEYLRTLLQGMNQDAKLGWAILIDELPIFLKALHDKGPDGVLQARNFMNALTGMQEGFPQIRWLITGSIGIGPLARAGQYVGTLAKYEAFSLAPLDFTQAQDFLVDYIQNGLIMGRTRISSAECLAIIHTLQWCSAYYLEVFAKALPVQCADDEAGARANIDAAMQSLLRSHQRDAFGTWEEHIRKHHKTPGDGHSFAILAELCEHETGLPLDDLQGRLGAKVPPERLRDQLEMLIDDGFLKEPSAATAGDARYAFRIPPLRLWWCRFRPQLAQ